MVRISRALPRLKLIELGLEEWNESDTLPFKTYFPVDIVHALENGCPVWALETDNVSKDDVLIGTLEQVRCDVLRRYNLSELPKDWWLTEVTREMIKTRRSSL